MIEDNLANLIERARTGDPDAGRQLADIVQDAIKMPDRRIGAALLPKRRGGDPEAERRAERNQAYQDFAVAEFGTRHLTPKQAKAINRQIRRLVSDAHRMEGDDSAKQNAVRRMMAAGQAIVGERQLLRILSEPEKKL